MEEPRRVGERQADEFLPLGPGFKACGAGLSGSDGTSPPAGRVLAAAFVDLAQEAQDLGLIVLDLLEALDGGAVPVGPV